MKNLNKYILEKFKISKDINNINVEEVASKALDLSGFNFLMEDYPSFNFGTSIPKFKHIFDSWIEKERIEDIKMIIGTDSYDILTEYLFNEDYKKEYEEKFKDDIIIDYKLLKKIRNGKGRKLQIKLNTDNIEMYTWKKTIYIKVFFNIGTLELILTGDEKY